ncbi:MAG: 2Fe-2S iron-sulfur cluster-binding protein [Chthoniobacterales bacterium]
MSDEFEPTAPDPHASLPSDSLDEILIFGSVETRRRFLKKVAGTSAALTFGPSLLSFSSLSAANAAAANSSNTMIDTQLKINGAVHKLRLDPRTTLLDLLRENLQLTGSKKGCDHGQCGACTVLVNGRRANSCLLLAVTLEGDEITTIEGLAQNGQLHPMQAAFVAHDGFQCGYCTPGQICSAVACVQEGHAKDDAQIREFMSGNLCRCGAYPNIVDAIKEARGQMGGAAS